MPIQHVTTAANETWTSLATRLSPSGCTATQLATFAGQLATANGAASTSALGAGRIVHVDDALIPVPPVTPPVDPPVDPPAVGVIDETFASATAVDKFTMLRGTLAVANGVLRPGTPTTEIDGVHKVDLGSSDHEVSADITCAAGAISGSYLAICARMAATGLTYYAVETSGDRGTLALVKCINGTYTQLASWSTGWAAAAQTHNVKLRAVGAAITVTVDGTQRMVASDTSIKTGTRVGVHAYVAATAMWSWDNLKAAKVTTTTPPVDPPVDPPVTPPATGVFKVVGRDIIGPDGKLFIPVGMNGMIHVNWAGILDGRAAMMKNDWKCNIVRIQCWPHTQTQGTSAQDLDWLFAVMDEYLAAGFVVMPASHDHTGSDVTWAQIQAEPKLLAWLDAIIARYKSNPYVWLNPLNEPTTYPGTMTNWTQLQNGLYDRARSKGWTGIFVADMGGWGQDMDQLAAYQAFAARENAVISYHAYGQSAAYQDANAAKLIAAKVPVIVGETGHTLDNSDGVTGTAWVMAHGIENHWGAIAWWGCGTPDQGHNLRQHQGASFYDTQYPLSAWGNEFLAFASKPRPTA